MLGCGVINFAVLRFLRHVVPGLTEVTAYDVQPGRAEQLRERCAAQVGNRDFVAASIGELAARGEATERDPSRITIVSPFGLGMTADNFLPTAETNHG